MVAFSALFVVRAIGSTSSDVLSEWSLFRLATLLELVHELERQALARYQADASEMSVVHAMARQLSREIRLLLRRKSTGGIKFSPASTTGSLASSSANVLSPESWLFPAGIPLNGSGGGTNTFGATPGSTPSSVQSNYLAPPHPIHQPHIPHQNHHSQQQQHQQASPGYSGLDNLAQYGFGSTTLPFGSDWDLSSLLLNEPMYGGGLGLSMEANVQTGLPDWNWDLGPAV